MRNTYNSAGNPAEGARRSKDRGGSNESQRVVALCERFGFRGVEFGSWMRQTERHSAVVRMDDLETLCDVFGWPEKAFGKIGPHGGIAIAFGARGVGGRMGHAGHFEASRNVINLKRADDAAAHRVFVHELGHAIDWHLGDGERFWSHGPEWKAVMDQVPEHMAHCKHLNAPSRKSGRADGYWTRPQEVFARSFEAFAFGLGYRGPLGAEKLTSVPEGTERDIACEAIDKLFANVTADIAGRQ